MPIARSLKVYVCKAAMNDRRQVSRLVVLWFRLEKQLVKAIEGCVNFCSIPKFGFHFKKKVNMFRGKLIHMEQMEQIDVLVCFCLGD